MGLKKNGTNFIFHNGKLLSRTQAGRFFYDEDVYHLSYDDIRYIRAIGMFYFELEGGREIDKRWKTYANVYMMFLFEVFGHYVEYDMAELLAENRNNIHYQKKIKENELDYKRNEVKRIAEKWQEDWKNGVVEYLQEKMNL